MFRAVASRISPVPFRTPSLSNLDTARKAPSSTQRTPIPASPRASSSQLSPLIAFTALAMMRIAVAKAIMPVAPFMNLPPVLESTTETAVSPPMIEPRATMLETSFPLSIDASFAAAPARMRALDAMATIVTDIAPSLALFVFPPNLSSSKNAPTSSPIVAVSAPIPPARRSGLIMDNTVKDAAIMATAFAIVIIVSAFLDCFHASIASPRELSTSLMALTVFLMLPITSPALEVSSCAPFKNPLTPARIPATKPLLMTFASFSVSRLLKASFALAPNSLKILSAEEPNA